MLLNIYSKSSEELKRTMTKSMLSDFYKIDRATLNKSLRIFCGDIFEQNRDFKKIRTLTLSEVKAIKMRLGEAPFLWKRDIVKITGANHQIIIDNIRAFPSIYCISESDYRSLNKLPCTVGKRIIEGLG